MKVNEGTIDRVIRVALAAVLFFLVFSGAVSGVWAWVAGVAGAAALVTGVLGFCGLYALIGVNTCPAPKAEG
jgi:hypothetical protein